MHSQIETETYNRNRIESQFLWWVQEGGYELKSGMIPQPSRLTFNAIQGMRPSWSVIDHSDAELLNLDKGELWIVAAGATKSFRQTPNGHTYSASERNHLHLDLGQINLQAPDFEERVLSFANTWGLLGRWMIRLKAEREQTPLFGEPMAMWTEAIQVIQTIQRLHEATKSQECIAQLSNWISCDHVIRLRTCQLLRSFPGRSIAPQLLIEVPLGDLEHRVIENELQLVLATNLFLNQLVTQIVSEGCYPSLILQDGGNIRLEARDLLGLIHQSLAADLMDRLGPSKTCLQCNTLFYPSSAKAKYCSDACKTRFRRARLASSTGGNNA